MKKLILLVGFFVSLSAVAQPRGHHHGSGIGWVAPLVIGGAIGYAITRPYGPPPPVYYSAPQPVYANPNYPMWYYCNEYRDYYPRISTCPSPWMPIVPR